MPNNDLGTSQPLPSIPGFNPGSGAGGDSLTYLRSIDGHMLGHNGLLGANAHDPNAAHADFDETPSLDVDD